ncbi:MAG: hypothetical protein EOM26_04235 [Alphaproteobacteria bacterium]|nr:hypothetical protein [Alphaproteobacteria bacterium]
MHADTARLVALHDQLLPLVSPGDRVVYLGNYSGYGENPVETLDELLTFRRLVLSIPGMMCEDVVYLRGAQEEMLQKLLQLQFAPDPTNVLLWMLGKGLAPTLKAYGICPHDGVMAAREGVMSLTRWTGEIRRKVRSHAGHETFTTHLRRAAFTLRDRPCPLLFVHAGIDPERALDDQGDRFWWAGQRFGDISERYDPFEKIIRGYDPRHAGLHINCVTATIDGGCGFGGPLLAARLSPQGDMEDLLEA